MSLFRVNLTQFLAHIDLAEPVSVCPQQRGVDEALLRPLNRLPLGPFEEHELPVVVETLNMNIPEFNESKSGLSPTNGESNWGYCRV